MSQIQHEAISVYRFRYLDQEDLVAFQFSDGTQVKYIPPDIALQFASALTVVATDCYLNEFSKTNLATIWCHRGGNNETSKKS
jgi:hypothetical protein